MKIKLLRLLLIAVLLVFTGCNSDDDDSTSFNAIVLREGNCGINDNIGGPLDYLIELDGNLVELPVMGNTIYAAANLPEEFMVEGLEINITFRDLNEDELFICPTVEGLEVFPVIYIETVE